MPTSKQENKQHKDKLSARSVVQQRNKGRQAVPLTDNRPQAKTQREIQEVANQSPQVESFKSVQKVADQSSNKKQPIQPKKVNNSGLPDNLKSGMENLSGHSMDDVKVHYNSDKPAQLNAHAYAQGNQIHLAPGQEKHLAHEAWHVIQQKQGRVQANNQLKSGVAINDDASLEKEADVMGEKALSSPMQLSKKAAGSKKTVVSMNSSNEPIQRVETLTVNEPMSQYLRDSQYPNGREYSWECKFYIHIHSIAARDDRNAIQVVIYITTPANEVVFANWQRQVTEKWSNKFACQTSARVNFPISVQIERRPDGDLIGYDVENVRADAALGKRGLFGTESMTKWGENDPQDIPHEVGHMIGNPDEYGTVHKLNRERNEWEAVPTPDEENIMVRGDNPIRMHHMQFIQSKADTILGPTRLVLNRPSAAPAAGASAVGAPAAGATAVAHPTGPAAAGPATDVMATILHKRRVKRITDHLMDNIGSIPAEVGDWLGTHDWNNDHQISQAAIEKLGL